MSIEVSRATLVTGPTLEPVTLAEARKQLELSPSDTAHDDHLTLLIQAAREQWEHDTDSCCLTQTWRVNLAGFCGYEIELPKRPVQSVIVTYYDASNVSQTLSTSIYSLDTASRRIVLTSLQSWPVTYERWDAVTVTYVAGYTSAANVPAIHKQAMRLLISHYFENRDMLMGAALQSMPAYEALVSRFLRSTYP